MGITCFHFIFVCIALSFLSGSLAVDPMCNLIASTTIASVTAYSMWSCTTAGVTSTNPCSPLWNGIGCSGSTVVSITLTQLGISGTYIFPTICCQYNCIPDFFKVLSRQRLVVWLGWLQWIWITTIYQVFLEVLL